MEWLLLIVLFSSAEDADIEFKPVQFKTYPECLAAAEAFVDKYPAFELRKHEGCQAVELPVVRSYVECIPKPSC